MKTKKKLIWDLLDIDHKFVLIMAKVVHVLNLLIFVLFFVLVYILFFSESFGGILPTKTHPMKAKTPLPEIEKHDLPIGTFRQHKELRMDETRMTIKLLFGHGSEDGLDNCRIDVIHDLLKKTGNVFTETADQASFFFVFIRF